MALAQRMTTFGSNHPGLNFLTGLIIGTALMAAATVAAVTLQSDDRVSAIAFTQSSLTQEWAAPRVTISRPVRSSQDDAHNAVRPAPGQTYSLARVQTEEQALAAPRVSVGQLPPLGRTWPSDEDAMHAERILVS